MNTSLFRRWLAAGTVALAMLGAAPAQADPFSNLFFFGDSLSDTGNLNIASGGAFPAPGTGPYFGGRFSDGPLWVETLAAGLGFSSAASPYLIGGNNFTFAGARTGTGNNPPGVLAQVAGIWGAMNAVADPNALYVVVAGGNDMCDARSLYTTNSIADQTGRQLAAAAAINNLGQSLGYLASVGAKHVLVANMADLGTTPEAALLGLQAASTDATARFDALFPALILGATLNLGLDVSFLDLAGLSQRVIADALGNGGAVYGITNVTSPCAGFPFSNGAACEVSLFSDALHPSAHAHRIIGAAALLAVGAIPEPSTVLLFAVGLVGIAVWSRRRT